MSDRAMLARTWATMAANELSSIDRYTLLHGIQEAVAELDRLDPPPGQCEHGVKDGGWCEPCNREYKRAAQENEAAEKARTT